ncbi:MULTISPECIES: hypothetical protein [Halomonas]|uniref:hypothetical protein n=1 Tax=Halomonas TaxID=2745 RepID=UPI0002F12A54|nr:MULTISPECIES: hypothetical protein [Halomonas]QFT83370.1 hypothetical protein FIU88_00125 [Halomonas sp. THAF12]
MSRSFASSLAMATLIGLFALGGCAVTDVHRSAPLDPDARWALLPIANHSETPLAGRRAESGLTTLLHQHGVASLTQAPHPPPSGLLDLTGGHDLQEALNWAQQQGIRYGVTGSVDEWQYKTGLDGEPAVGLSLRVVDVNSGETLWSASGARSGWGFSTTSGVGQELMADLVDELPLER